MEYESLVYFMIVLNGGEDNVSYLWGMIDNVIEYDWNYLLWNFMMNFLNPLKLLQINHTQS